MKIPVTEQIVKYSDRPVWHRNNHATLKIIQITFLSHSDIQFGVQEIVLTRTTVYIYIHMAIFPKLWSVKILSG